MGHYLKSPKDGKFYYNPTIKRSTLLRDYERTTPIRHEIAGVRRRTWQRKEEPPEEPGIYEYTVYSSETGPEGRRTTFEGRTTLEIDPDDDPYSKENMRKAKAKIRRGYDRLYMEQIGEILDDPEVEGVRKVDKPMRGVEVGTIRRGRMYRSVEGKPVEKLLWDIDLGQYVWKQMKWVKQGGRWSLELLKPLE